MFRFRDEEEFKKKVKRRARHYSFYCPAMDSYVIFRFSEFWEKDFYIRIYTSEDSRDTDVDGFIDEFPDLEDILNKIVKDFLSCVNRNSI